MSNGQKNTLLIPADDGERHARTTEQEPRQPTTLHRGPLSHLTDRRVEIIPVGQLTPYRKNARTHSKKQIRQIADRMRRFGFTNPVLIDDGGQIIAGHGRIEAAKLLGLTAVPAVRISHLSDAEKRAYILADNRLAEKAGWDREILANELQALIDLEFEVDLTGFEAPYVDMVLDAAAEVMRLYRSEKYPSSFNRGAWQRANQAGGLSTSVMRFV